MWGGLFGSFFFFFFLLPSAVVVVEKRLMYSLSKGGPGVLPRKILENLECRKSHLPHFLGLFFIFLFYVNQFSLFFFFAIL